MGGAFYRDPELRKLAESLECALLLPRFTPILRESNPAWPLTNARLGAADGILTLLARLAQDSAHPELATAPLVLWAHSRTGQLGATFAALHPHRTIALLRYHTAGGGLGGPDMATLTKIPVLLIDAKDDIEQNKRNGVPGEPSESVWRTGRAAGAPGTCAIEPDAVHQNPENLKTANALVLPWIAAVLRLRLSETAPGLRPIPDKAGWLADDETGTISAASTFRGSQRSANWLPDEQSAQGWRVVVGKAK